MADETRNVGQVLVARIEALRLEQGWTVEELAERADVTPELLERFLADAPNVGISVILRLVTALGVEPEGLLDGIEWTPDGQGGGEYHVRDHDRDGRRGDE